MYCLRTQRALAASFFASIAARMRSAVIGMCVIRTPMASKMALPIAGAVGAIVASQNPLAWKGPSG